MRIESIQCDICKKPLASEELFVNFMAFFCRKLDGEQTSLPKSETIDVCQSCFDEKFAAYFPPENNSSSEDIIDSIAAQRFP